ncbi:hypothetical protein D3C71_1137000 [compost metagenome]
MMFQSPLASAYPPFAPGLVVIHSLVRHSAGMTRSDAGKRRLSSTSLSPSSRAESVPSISRTPSSMRTSRNFSPRILPVAVHLPDTVPWASRLALSVPPISIASPTNRPTQARSAISALSLARSG